MLMKQFTLAFCLLASMVARAQTVIDVNKVQNAPGQSLYFIVGGVPFVNAKFVSLVEGTPYYKDEWLKGSLVSTEGKEFKNLLLKLDLVDNEVHYQDEKGNELI